MPGSVAPYSDADTSEATRWFDYVEAAFCGLSGDDAVAATVEAIDKAHRRGAISESVAALLSEIYDVPHEAYAMA